MNRQREAVDIGTAEFGYEPETRQRFRASAARRHARACDRRIRSRHRASGNPSRRSAARTARCCDACRRSARPRGRTASDAGGVRAAAVEERAHPSGTVVALALTAIDVGVDRVDVRVSGQRGRVGSSRPWSSAPGQRSFSARRNAVVHSMSPRKSIRITRIRCIGFTWPWSCGDCQFCRRDAPFDGIRFRDGLGRMSPLAARIRPAYVRDTGAIHRTSGGQRRVRAASAGLYSVRMASPRPVCVNAKRPTAPHDGDATGRMARQPFGVGAIST